jgi:hypothetical protein
MMAQKRKFIPKENREFIINRDGRQCYYCGSAKSLEVDHIIPLKHGGTNVAGNLVCSCSTCNRRKNGNRLLPRYEMDVQKFVDSSNVSIGIDGFLDMAYKLRIHREKSSTGIGRENYIRTKPKVSDEGKGERQRLALERRRIKASEKKLAEFFGARGLVGLLITEDNAATVRVRERLKKRKQAYFSFPVNAVGGKAYLLRERDGKKELDQIDFSSAIALMKSSIMASIAGNVTTGYCHP